MNYDVNTIEHACSNIQSLRKTVFFKFKHITHHAHLIWIQKNWLSCGDKKEVGTTI